MNYMEEAFGPAEAKYKARVLAATFGHLAPKPMRTYQGQILFAYGEYGDIVPIKVSFDGLPDSPWFFEDMQDFICKRVKRQGQVYRFVGTYRKGKDGEGRFCGRVRMVRIEARPRRRKRVVHV